MIIDIHLPTEGEILISSGQKIDFDTPVIKKKTKTDLKIPLASTLKIPAKKIFNSLKKFVGEPLKKGDLLAEAKSMFGHKKYFSETDGVLKEINHHDGYIVIEADSDDENTIISFFKGEISGIDDRIIHLKVSDSKQFPLHEASDNFGGEVFYHQNTNELITGDTVNKKVAVVKQLLGYDQVKLETLGVTGFIHVNPLLETTQNPKAQIKNPDQWDDIIKLNYPYCIIDKENTTMCFYTI